jgi:hypothetical protein
MKIFDFGRNNRLSLTLTVDEDAKSTSGFVYVGWWLNGRIFRKFISMFIDLPRFLQREVK